MTSNLVELRDAVQLARVDWAEGFAESATLSTYEVAVEIRGSLNLPQYEGDERPWTWIDHGDESSAAYRRLLEATPEEIEQLRDVDDVVTSRVYDVPFCACSNDYMERTGLHHEGCLRGLAGQPEPALTSAQLSQVNLRIVS